MIKTKEAIHNIRFNWSDRKQRQQYLDALKGGLGALSCGGTPTADQLVDVLTTASSEFGGLTSKRGRVVSNWVHKMMLQGTPTEFKRRLHRVDDLIGFEHVAKAVDSAKRNQLKALGPRIVRGYLPYVTAAATTQGMIHRAVHVRTMIEGLHWDLKVHITIQVLKLAVSLTEHHNTMQDEVIAFVDFVFSMLGPYRYSGRRPAVTKHLIELAKKGYVRSDAELIEVLAIGTQPLRRNHKSPRLSIRPDVAMYILNTPEVEAFRYVEGTKAAIDEVRERQCEV